MAFSWPGVYNPDWSWMQKPQNLGMGAPGYDISGLNPTSYYNSSGPLSAGMGAKNPWASPYGDQGSANNYGYGGLTGMGGTPLAAMAPNTQGVGAMSPAGGGGGTWSPGTGPAGAPLGGPTQAGGIDYSPVGDQEHLLDKLFKGSLTGQGGGPIAQMLHSMGMGMLPPALAQQIMGQSSEQFGKLGARFGTDLATAQSRGLAQAAESRSLDAIQQMLGLGGTTAGFQFQRGESGMERSLRAYLGQLQTDPMNGILQSLLGGLG